MTITKKLDRVAKAEDANTEKLVTLTEKVNSLRPGRLARMMM